MISWSFVASANCCKWTKFMPDSHLENSWNGSVWKTCLFLHILPSPTHLCLEVVQGHIIIDSDRKNEGGSLVIFVKREHVNYWLRSGGKVKIFLESQNISMLYFHFCALKNTCENTLEHLWDILLTEYCHVIPEPNCICFMESSTL